MGDADTPPLGVVFVHGIGGQHQGQTVTQWGDPLIEWLKHHPDVTGAEVGEARLRPQGGDPSHAFVSLDTTNGPRCWLMAEAWWQGELEVPAYRDLAMWAIKVLPATLFAHLAGISRRLRVERGARTGFAAARSFALLVVVIGLAVPTAILFAPAFALLTLLLLVVGLLPIAGIRSAVLRVQRMMTGVVGDSMMMINSRTHEGAMTSRVVAAVDFVRAQGCERVAVLAHSQGAAIAKEAFSKSNSPRVDCLVTVGSGINKLEHLKDTAARSTWSWLPPIFLLAVFAVSFRVLDDLRTGRISAAQLLGYSVGVAVVFIVVALIANRLESASGPPPIVFLATPILLGLLPGTVQWLLVMLALLGVIALLVASQMTERQVEVEPGFEDNVRRWIDVYAHSDPIPNGATYTAPESGPLEIEVHNLDSVLRDHTYYARASDDALTAIGELLLQICEGTANPFVRSEVARRAAGRRRWRVACLRFVRWLVSVAIALGVFANYQHLEPLGRWVYRSAGQPLPDQWIPMLADSQGAAFKCLGAVLIVLAGLATYYVLFGVWRTWTEPPYPARDSSANAPDQGSADEEPDSGPYVEVLAAACAGLVVLALRADDVYRAVSDDEHGWLNSLGDQIPWLLGILAIGIGTRVVLRRTDLEERLSKAPDV